MNHPKNPPTHLTELGRLSLYSKWKMQGLDAKCFSLGCSVTERNITSLSIFLTSRFPFTVRVSFRAFTVASAFPGKRSECRTHLVMQLMRTLVSSEVLVWWCYHLVKLLHVSSKFSWPWNHLRPMQSPTKRLPHERGSVDWEKSMAELMSSLLRFNETKPPSHGRFLNIKWS